MQIGHRAPLAREDIRACHSCPSSHSHHALRLELGSNFSAFSAPFLDGCHCDQGRFPRSFVTYTPSYVSTLKYDVEFEMAAGTELAKSECF